ncbi:MAG TPA: GTPase Era [Clostridiales bacterium]|nr:GTPase Era [Clostridiales bacterium]
MAKFRSGFITIIGRPNAGKSTLMNTILQQKIAIVSDKPQTTQNKIRGFYTTDDAQLIFIDTPGIHKPKHKLGEFMNEAAKSAGIGADVIFYIVDAAEPFGKGEAFIIHTLPKETPVFLLLNKIDLLEKDALLAVIQLYSEKFDFAEIIPVSALKDDHIDDLLQTVIGYLPEGPCYYPEDMVTDQPERAIMAEIVREKVLECTGDEVPHAVAVEMLEVKERPDGMIYASAVIYAERDSQKGILIGKNGVMLKKIGRAARLEMERTLGSKFYLDLWVKVKKDWRNKEVYLRNFGFDRNKLNK